MLDGMIDFAEELQRLMSTPSDGVAPTALDFLVQVHVSCVEGASAVLKRVRGLLSLVIRYRLEHPPDDEIEPNPNPFAVPEEYWKAVLPSWFLDCTPFLSAAKPSSAWTVEGWLYWFLSTYEDRDWRWYSVSVASPSRFTVTLQVTDLPFAWEALRWALFAAGATSAEWQW